jgi:uronate dehydrogenase
VLFASSDHAIVLYRRARRLDHATPPRPDGRCGLSKAFGEDLAALCADKFGVCGFCMRIGLRADYGFEIVLGMSRNTRAWWDNASACRPG